MSKRMMKGVRENERERMSEEVRENERQRERRRGGIRK